MVILAALGILAILAGMIVATDRIDNHWRGKRKIVIPARAPSLPVFRTSPRQCPDCGNADLLSIDTGQCLNCFEMKRVKSG